jgi:esterase/lipase
MQIYDDYQQSEHAKKILQIKRDIRKNFKEYSEAVRESMDTQLKKVHEMGFDLPITNIDEALHEIRSQVEGKSDSANALQAQLDESKIYAKRFKVPFNISRRNYFVSSVLR